MEGDVRFSKAQDQPSVTTHVRVGNQIVSHSFDVVSKIYKNIIYSHFVLNFHGHSQCPCINVARLSVLHYDRIANVNIQGKS